MMVSETGAILLVATMLAIGRPLIVGGIFSLDSVEVEVDDGREDADDHCEGVVGDHGDDEEMAETAADALVLLDRCQVP